jgi:SAM-dependent methyltransferase
LEALLQQESAPFDVVAMSHVVEHLPDPIGFLSRLRKTVLKKDGYLLVEVPNLYGHESFEVAHNFSFSPHTLRQLLHVAGYRVEALETHGCPRSDLIPLYITAFAQPAPHYADKNIQSETGVAMRRRLAMLRRKILLRFFRGSAWKEI